MLALLAAAAAWRFGPGDGDEGTWARLAEGVLGAAFGVAAVMVPIAVASWWGRRWPLYPGDAMLLGAMGFLLGPLGLAWTMALGAGFALVYRFCVQRRRGRPFRKGLVPLGPGMCAGAAVVFLCLDCGLALAQETAPPAPMAATELAPERSSLPAALAAREIVLEGRVALPFPALVRRLAALSDVAMRIEERPSRIAGGEAVLAEPPPLRLAWRGTLGDLLDRVAAQTGYDWSWETLGPETLVPETLMPGSGAVVFHRYWDTDQRGAWPGGDRRGRRHGKDRRRDVVRRSGRARNPSRSAGGLGRARRLDPGVGGGARLARERAGRIRGRLPGGCGPAPERPGDAPCAGGAGLRREPPPRGGRRGRSRLVRAQGAVARLAAAGLAVLLAGPLAGCTTWAPKPAAVELQVGPDAAEMRLVEAAERAERALSSLARTLPAPDGGPPRHAAAAMPALDTVPAALRRPLTLDWAGPLEGLVRELARRAGYRFLVAGRPPARPLIVDIKAEREPVLAVLRDAGLRAGGAATLTVNAAAETVLLDWTVSAPSAARLSTTLGEEC